MKANIKTIPIIIIIIIIFYYIQFFIFNTISSILDQKLIIKKPLLIILSIVILTSLTKTSLLMWTKMHFILYYIYAIYLGYIFNSLLSCLIFRLINIIININKNYSCLLVIYFPLIISLYGIINARIIRIEKEVIIKTKKYKNNNPLKICHLTDLHLGLIYQKNFTRKIVNMIKNNIKPEIIVITGDLFDFSNIPNYEFIEPFNELDIPILYVTGNHEVIIGKNEIFNILNKTKIKNIGDQLIPYKFKNINFMGLDYESKIEKLKDITYDKNKFNIVLNHVPIPPQELTQYNIDLFLCGHTHGGQTFPFNVLTFLNSKCYVGLYEYLNIYTYVSSGLGTALIPMRIGSKSVISIIKIESLDED